MLLHAGELYLRFVDTRRSHRRVCAIDNVTESSLPRCEGRGEARRGRWDGGSRHRHVSECGALAVMRWIGGVVSKDMESVRFVLHGTGVEIGLVALETIEKVGLIACRKFRVQGIDRFIGRRLKVVVQGLGKGARRA